MSKEKAYLAGAVGVAAIGYGIYKGAQGYFKNNEADEINEKAKEIVDEYVSKLDESREKCEKSLSSLGEAKFDALTKNINRFIDVYRQLQHVELAENNGLSRVNISDFDSYIPQFEQQISILQTSGIGIVGGGAVSAMTAFGAYNGTLALATTSAGKAIATLNGIAAKNAALAWLGGGSLAAGGFGVAGGVVILNMIAAAPGLLVAGWFIDNQAEKSLNNAKSNEAIAKKFKAEAITAITLTDGIVKAAEKANHLVSLLRTFTRRRTEQIRKIIEEQGTDFQKYDNTSKRIISNTVTAIKILKDLIDTPIIDENGKLLNTVSHRIDQLESNFKNM